MGLITKSAKSTTQEVAVISNKIKKTKFSISDLIIPISSGILLIVLSVAVFIPMLRSAFEYLDQIKETDEKISQLKEFNKKLDSIDENTLNEDVVVARKVIPRILKVSDFVYYIDGLAVEKGLEITELSAGDTSGGATSGTGVSGPVVYSGEYSAVISFLEDVQSVSPYIIRLQNVEVSANDEGRWNISLNVSGYYLLDTGKDPDIYAPFQNYTEYADIVEIFKRKAEGTI
ncbi:MAG: hypothetical protein UR34_C0003G0030 [candidate division WS6 bacterium GW2011_GWC1_33_20]|uniref:Uncharacterized protein n=2 Tax=Candidatus Dojkabacteria TaxID=74243 RepID=A0A0G0AF94_9BACT|nr:MAG: hypothetical protein UR32_C0003G0015 [candidate division WS6 bacterium GW2011_GWE2_33_157]KKP44404.1 MAG: hypothetical protein UR34_C0003G0030 [candidate division WS6 bacterium GW2011_GWC1_33_20]KKP46034.1 MAG: hypothetical protein UR36_C0002G0076 [candidate division WS6 bacterium GW2011_GWF1_33_233]KKP55454.1 MAG: hypothetical protein UR47_C0001G0015 [candidate division WS6 bacterium GW2011_GWB1_33_6]KKP55533.1 MAG: hypothetical protein UR45_C0001G0015 [candidate division WS6 bacterium